MSACAGLREEREVGRRLARQIAGLFEQGMRQRERRDERFQRRVVRHSQSMMKTWRSRLPLAPTLSRGERELGGAGWRVWNMPARLWNCAP